MIYQDVLFCRLSLDQSSHHYLCFRGLARIIPGPVAERSASSLAVNLHLPHTQPQIDATYFGKIGDGAMRRCASRGTAPPSSPPPLQALENGVRGRATPPVHCVALLVSSGSGAERKQHDCLTRLDAQPEGSVVLLCFGSMGTCRGGSSKRSPSGWKNPGRGRHACRRVHRPGSHDYRDQIDICSSSASSWMPHDGPAGARNSSQQATPHRRCSAWDHAALMDCLGA